MIINKYIVDQHKTTLKLIKSITAFNSTQVAIHREKYCDLLLDNSVCRRRDITAISCRKTSHTACRTRALYGLHSALFLLDETFSSGVCASRQPVFEHCVPSPATELWHPGQSSLRCRHDPKDGGHLRGPVGK